MILEEYGAEDRIRFFLLGVLWPTDFNPRSVVIIGGIVLRNVHSALTLRFGLEENHQQRLLVKFKREK